MECFFIIWNVLIISEKNKEQKRKKIKLQKKIEETIRDHIIIFPKIRKSNLFPMPSPMQCHLFGNRCLFPNLSCHLPKNIDLFLFNDVSAGAGKQIVLRKRSFLDNRICFPIFRKKALSWKRETDISGKWARWLLLE